MFTRFGTRLEASMERAIQRGQLLREALKQDRLETLPAVFQLAWLIAFNDRRLDHVDAGDIAGALNTLAERTEAAELDVDSPREEWSAAIADWLPIPDTEVAGT